MNLDVSATDWTSPLNDDIPFDLVPEHLFPVLQPLQCSKESRIQCGTDPSAIMSTLIDSDSGRPAHVALFADTLAETGSPARAMQAWLNVMMRQKFYDSLDRSRRAPTPSTRSRCRYLRRSSGEVSLASSSCCFVIWWP
jgi:hypothetical protein